MAIIAIDFDGVIIDDKGKPLPGIKHAIDLWRERGHKVIVHSCNNIDWIVKNMNEFDLRYDGINTERKPLADLYIDDKGYQHWRNAEWTPDEAEGVLNRLTGKDNRKWKAQ